MKKNKNIHPIENLSNEYFSICKENGEIIIHIGFHEAHLNNKQVDKLIEILKNCKIYE